MFHAVVVPANNAPPTKKNSILESFTGKLIVNEFTGQSFHINNKIDLMSHLDKLFHLKPQPTIDKRID